MSGWVKQTVLAGGQINSVWGFAADDVYVCTNNAVIHWDGVSWTNEPLAIVANWQTLWGPDSTSLYVFSSLGRVAHKIGGIWHDVGFVMTGAGSVKGSWGTSNLFILASQATKIENSTDGLGGIWTDVYTAPSTAGFIRGYDGDHVFSYVRLGSQILYSSHKGTWTAYAQPNRTWLDIWPDTITSGWAVDNAGETIVRVTNGGLTISPQTLPDDDFQPKTIYGQNALVIYCVGLRPSNHTFRALRYEGNDTWIDDPDGVDGTGVGAINQLWVDPVSGFAVAAGATTVYQKAAPDTLTMLSAVAASTNSVTVVLASEPENSSPTGVGDALNPDTWTITRTDTGFEYTVTTIVKIDSFTYLVSVLEAFGSQYVTHEVTAPNMLRRDGDPMNTPDSATFIGMLTQSNHTTTAISASRRFVPTDIANPSYQSSGSPGGTLTISGGDYRSETGQPLLKKLINRRLSSRKGSYFHLPNYGLGLDPKTKIASSDLIKTQTQAQKQIMLEPDVQSAKTAITQDVQGILYVTWSAVEKTTQKTVGGSVTPGGGGNQ